MEPGKADVLTAAPTLNLTPEEKRVFGQLFREADKENIGVVTGEVAVKFFEKTRLEPRILGEVCISCNASRLQQDPAYGAWLMQTIFLDMADCGQRESRASNTRGVWDCPAIDRTLPSRTRSHS